MRGLVGPKSLPLPSLEHHSAWGKIRASNFSPLVWDQVNRFMPIYEYQCQACEAQLEALQKISDAPLLECPKCGESSLKKKISAAAFRLKGAGWYETDFKTGNKKNLAGAADSASSGESKPSDSAAASTSTKTSTSDSTKSA